LLDLSDFLGLQGCPYIYSLKLDPQMLRSDGWHYIYYIMLTTGIESLQSALNKSDVAGFHIEHNNSISFHTDFMLT
jgi:hypothetical protein